jgi:hypothetical protein
VDILVFVVAYIFNYWTASQQQINASFVAIKFLNVFYLIFLFLVAVDSNKIIDILCIKNYT